MKTIKDLSTRENISHITRTEPYSIYRTVFTSEQKSALYLHWHPEVEFLFLQEGELDLFIESACYHLQSGDAMFIPPNLLHSANVAASENGIFYALVFSTDLIIPPSDTARYQKYVQPLLHDNQQFCLHLRSGQNYESKSVCHQKRESDMCASTFIHTESSNVSNWHLQILQDLRRIFHAQSAVHSDPDSDPFTDAADDFLLSTDLLTEGMLRVIWQELYQFHLSELYNSNPPGRLSDQLQNVIHFIHQHYQEDITLDTLAKIAHISDAQLCRTFKQLTGSTPFTYLKRYRIMKSCEWLLNSQKKISEICGLCGFNNVSYYNREFLKIMKVTPSAYRKHRIV